MIKNEIVYVQTIGDKRKMVPVCRFETEAEAQESIRMIKRLTRNQKYKKQARFTETKKHNWDVKEISQLIEIFQNDSRGLPFLFILKTGIRAGELCALTWSDIDLKAETITINKSANRERGVLISRATRVINLPKGLIEDLSLHKKRQKQVKGEELIFTNNKGDLLSPDLLKRQFKVLLRKIEITQEIILNDLRSMYKISNGIL